MSKSKLFLIAGAVAALVVPSAALAAKPGEIYNAHTASVNNTNANPNAVWGQDRSFYASEKFFGANMDIKQSFPTDLGGVGEQRAAWVAEFGG
jgi:cytochrome c556